MKKQDVKDVLNEVKNANDYADIIDIAIEALMLNPVAIKNLVEKVSSLPIFIKEAVYWSKFNRFVKEVRQAEKDFGQSISLSDKLFSDSKKKRENGIRLLGYIDKADSEKKIDYYINATRSLLLTCINSNDYFRIIKAISETLNEDLEYLADIALNSNTIKGNIQILALERSGLVIQAGIDAEENIESQNYVVSSLGRMVDRYSISFENEEHHRYFEQEIGTYI